MNHEQCNDPENHMEYHWMCNMCRAEWVNCGELEPCYMCKSKAVAMMVDPTKR